MDIDKMYEAVKLNNNNLKDTFPKIKESDEKFLKQVISFYHLNMSPSSKFDPNKIKKDSIEDTRDIIEYMESLYQTTQTYFNVIENMNKELQKKN